MSLENRAELLSELVAERAEAQGILDVAYTSVDSPLGPLLVAATSRGLVRVSFADRPGASLDELAERVSPRVLESPRRLDHTLRQLDEYFRGERRRFDIRLDWHLTSDFQRRVLQAAARIPYGQVSTYTDVAAGAGSPRGARAAGNALSSNPLPIVLPCHRVLNSGGRLGGYAGGPDNKRLLLGLEGVLE